MPQWDDPKPGYQWPVAVTPRIAVPVDRVWEVISMPSNLELCHPLGSVRFTSLVLRFQVRCSRRLRNCWSRRPAPGHIEQGVS
jgi:hypothetical protein